MLGKMISYTLIFVYQMETPRRERQIQTIDAYYVPCPFKIRGVLGKTGKPMEGN